MNQKKINFVLFLIIILGFGFTAFAIHSIQKNNERLSQQISQSQTTDTMNMKEKSVKYYNLTDNIQSRFLYSQFSRLDFNLMKSTYNGVELSLEIWQDGKMTQNKTLDYITAINSDENIAKDKLHADLYVTLSNDKKTIQYLGDINSSLVSSTSQPKVVSIDQIISETTGEDSAQYLYLTPPPQSLKNVDISKKIAVAAWSNGGGFSWDIYGNPKKASRKRATCVVVYAQAKKITKEQTDQLLTQ